VEVGETTLEALARELAEEGNIVLGGTPELYGIYFNRRVSRRDHVAVYVVRQFRQSGMPRPNREIAECGFFDLRSLPAETTAGTRARIREVVEGVARSTDWS